MYRVKEGIIGLAIGDALGVPTKNQNREYLLDHPILKMTPRVYDGLPKGAWSDSTSLTIATMTAINKKGINYDYIAENCVSWFTSNKFCSVSESFGIDKTTLKALVRFTQRQLPAYECGESGSNSDNNSGLKMMLPLAYYFNANKESKNTIYDIVKKVTSITHKNDIAVCASYIYVYYLMFILNGNNKFAAIKQLRIVDYSMFKNDILDRFSRILVGNIYELDIDEISTSDFVVDTLESVLWCFLKSDNFKDCLVASTNIGGDTSTIGALVGAIAGIYYGTNKIPKDWIDNLRKKDYLTDVSEEYERYLRLLSYSEHL